MSSIREVAKLAGVSPATVSRVMNGTARVAPEKQASVLAAIQATGFVPNELARSLYRKSARMIGLVIPSIRNPFFTQLADEMDRLAEQYGYRLFVCNVGDDLEKERTAFRTLAAMNADGIVFASGSEEIQQHLSKYQIPVVALDTRISLDEVKACIYSDYYQGGRLSMEHLLDCGCRQIVCIRGPQNLISAKRRYEGYRDVCLERGIPERTVECDYDFEKGLEMTEALLERYPDVDGIIACNDMVAISTYKVLRKKNIPVPDRVQLVGFDDIDSSTLMTPELTTIRQPIRVMAEKAMDCLLQPGKGSEKGTELVLPVSLMIRETTKRGGRVE